MQGSRVTKAQGVIECVRISKKRNIIKDQEKMSNQEDGR